MRPQHIAFTALSFFSCLSVFVLCSAANADTIDVPADFPTIQQAINAAGTGDTIQVAPGFYDEGPISLLGKSLTIKSTGGPSVTEVTSRSAGSQSVFLIDNDEVFVEISGFEITGGTGSNGYGGGLQIDGTSEVEVWDCWFTENTADIAGGGLYASGGVVLTIMDCVFAQNFSSQSGGGAHLDCETSAQVVRTRFEGNRALSIGGGLLLGAGNLGNTGALAFADNCVFSGNVAATAGGAMYCRPQGATSLGLGFCGASFCTFSGNVAPVNPAMHELGGPVNATAIAFNSILANNLGQQMVYGISIINPTQPPVGFRASLLDFLTPEEAESVGLLSGEAGFVSEFGSDGLSGTGDEDFRLTPVSIAIDQAVDELPYTPSTLDVNFDSRNIDDPLVAPNGTPGPNDLGATEFDLGGSTGTLAIWAIPTGADLLFMRQSNWVASVLPEPGIPGLVRMPSSRTTAVIEQQEFTDALLFDGGEMHIRRSESAPSNSGLNLQTSSGIRSMFQLVERPGESTDLTIQRLEITAGRLLIEGGSLTLLDTEFYIEASAGINSGAELSLLDGSELVSTSTSSPMGCVNYGLLFASHAQIHGNYSQRANELPGFEKPAGTLLVAIDGEDDSRSSPDLEVTGNSVLAGTIAVSVGPGYPTPGVQVPLLGSTTIDGTFDLVVSQGLPDGIGLQVTTTNSLGGGESANAETYHTSHTTFSDLAASPVWPYGIEDSQLADLDNDGDDDLVLSLTREPGETGSYVAFLQNLGMSGSTWLGFDTLALGTNTVRINGTTNGLHVRDLDNDGLPEIAVANKENGTFHVLGNFSDPLALSFTELYSDDTSPDLATGTAQPTDVWMGDLDNDGKNDLIATNETDGTVVAFKNMTSLVFAFGPGSSSRPARRLKKITPTGTGTARDEQPFSTAKGSSNSDGEEEEGASEDDSDDDDGGTVETGGVGLGVGSEIRLVWTWHRVGRDPVDSAAGDLNEDGFRDIVTANNAGQSVSILLADGASGFQQALTIPVGLYCQSIELGDFDDDGDLDIVLMATDSSGNGDVRVLRNDTISPGPLSFTLENDSLFSGNGVNDVDVGNLDDDRYLDIVVQAITPSLKGDTAPGWMTALVGTATVCIGDLNSDGEVAGADLGILLGAWGTDGAATGADIDGNGNVDGADLAAILAAWGTCETTELED